MLKSVALLVPLFATSALAETTTTVVVTQGQATVTEGPPSVAPPIQPPGAADMPPPPPAPAPQNENWNNVSHINGVPVRVGERGDYLYKFKKTNISVNPFGPFFGLYDIGIAYAVGQNVAASVSITRIDDFFQLSGTVPIYFRRTYSGPFLEPGLLIRTERNYDDCYYASDCMDSRSAWVGPQLMFGWHWTFDSGLNLAFAAGVAKKMDSDSGNSGNAYFRVGYAF